MDTVLSPIVSEFETEAQAASYDRWFQAKVWAAIRSSKPRLPHDQVMAEIQTRLDAKRKARDAC